MKNLASRSIISICIGLSFVGSSKAQFFSGSKIENRSEIIQYRDYERLEERELFADTRLGAKDGDAQSQFQLAMMYAKGQGVPQDYKKAAKWLHKSALQGYLYAQTALGFYYARGTGVKQDYTESLKWFQLGAIGGDPDAQYALGMMYWDGLAVPQNVDEAAKWFQLSAQQGKLDARGALCSINAKRFDALRSDNVAEGILRKCVYFGDVDAERALCSSYDQVAHKPKTDDDSLDILRVCAKKGYAEAQLSLGQSYADGLGVPRNYNEAFNWFSASASRGYASAQKYLDRFVERLRTEAKLGDKDALSALAVIYAKGNYDIAREVRSLSLPVYASVEAKDQNIKELRAKINEEYKIRYVNGDTAVRADYLDFSALDIADYYRAYVLLDRVCFSKGNIDAPIKAKYELTLQKIISENIKAKQIVAESDRRYLMEISYRLAESTAGLSPLAGIFVTGAAFIGLLGGAQGALAHCNEQTEIQITVWENILDTINQFGVKSERTPIKIAPF